MADLNDDILDDGDAVGNYDLDIVDEDALLADDFEESSSKRTLVDDEDFIDMGVEEDLTDLGSEVGETGKKRKNFGDANDSDGESEERSRFRTERAFPSKRQTSSIPETLDAVPVKPTGNQTMIHRGGGRGRGIRSSLSSRLGAKRGGGAMRPQFQMQHPNFNRPQFYPNQFHPPNYPSFPPQPPMYYPPYPHQQGPQPPPPSMPAPPPQAAPVPPNQPSIHGPNIHVNPHFRSNINAFWNGANSWNNNSSSSSAPPVISSSSQDYSNDWSEQPPPPGPGAYQQNSQYYNNGQEYYMPPQQDPYYQQQTWQGPGPGNPQGNNWDANYYNPPNMQNAPQPNMVDYPRPPMPMGGPQGPPGPMLSGPPGQRHLRPMGPRIMRPHLNPQVPRPGFRNNPPNFQVRPHLGTVVGIKNKVPVQPNKMKPPVPPVPLNKLKSSSSHRSMEVLRTVVITDLPQANSAASSSNSTKTTSLSSTSQPSPQPPTEEEDEELKEYRKKIEEQKKLRAEVLRIKEEKRKVAAQQKSQQLEEGLQPVGPQEELLTVRVRTPDNNIVLKKVTSISCVPPTGIELIDLEQITKLPVSQIEKMRQCRMNCSKPPATGNGQLPKKVSEVAASRVVLVDNLSASTSQKQLEELAKTVGPVESVNLDGEAKKAIVKFQGVESAQAFLAKFQRKMVDLSMISVSMVSE